MGILQNKHLLLLKLKALHCVLSQTSLVGVGHCIPLAHFGLSFLSVPFRLKSSPSTQPKEKDHSYEATQA